MIENEIRLVDQWFAQNNIDARWVNDKTFFIDDIRYLYLRRKIEQGENKIFSQDFAFLIDEAELEEFMTGDGHKVDFYCFEFGGKVYYSAITDKPELNLFKHLGKAKDVSGFDYLGIHGGFELCSGSRTYDDWCKKAKFLGVTTLGLCEKHTLAGALKFQLACAKHKIKSIIGETINIKGKQGEYRVKIYVANQEGWGNLLKIHKRLNIDNAGKFVEEEELINRGEGLYCVFSHDTLINETILDKYLTTDRFKGIYFQFDPVQYKAEKRDLQCLNCLKEAIKIGMPLILICDSYYLDQEDHRVKQILQFIGSVGFEYQSDNQHFKSLEDVSLQTLEMFETKGDEFALSILEQALQGLKEVSGGCEFSIELGKIRLPPYHMTTEEATLYDDNESLLWGLLQKGLELKIVEKGKDLDLYFQRLNFEVDVISRGGFIEYFLILSDLVRWCKEQDILSGIGRGSSAGSLVAYLLDITKADPLEYDLLFDRFLNSSRIGKSLPDIDFDVSGEHRDEVKRYIETRYGEQNVCSIGTYGTFKLKAAFRDICRMKGIPAQQMNYFAAMLELRENEGNVNQLFINGSKIPVLKEFLEEYSEAINDIDLIFEQPKNASIHAAGVIITPSTNQMTVFDWMPVKIMDGILVSEWEGLELEKAGFLKEDILGIKQLDKFMSIFKLIKRNEKQVPTFESINYNDKKILELFKRGWNQDLFHFGSTGLTSYSQDVKPDSIEDLIAMIALYRPGVMESGAHESYVKIRQGKKKPEYDWGCEEITKSTSSIITYQEQAMKICQVIGGFSSAESDNIRKCLHKDTLMWTENGYFPISQLQKRSHILTFSDIEIKNKVNKTCNIFRSGEKKCIKLIFRSGRELICTKDHKIYTSTGWVEASRTLGKYVLHEVNEKYGTHIESKTILYLITALITEGYVGGVGGGGFVNQDQREIKAFTDAYETLFKKKPRVDKHPTSGCYSVGVNKSDIEFLGVTRVLSKDKTLPDYFLRLERDLHYFVLGKLIDFDGGIQRSSRKGSKSMKISYYSKSKKLVDQIHLMFECLGVRAQLSRVFNHDYDHYYYTVHVADREDVRTVYDKLKGYSYKISNLKEDDFLIDDETYSEYSVPHNIWYPIISNLINSSGYKTNNILGANVMGNIHSPVSITINRLKKILTLCGRSKLLEFFLKRETYWDVVSRIETVKQKQTVYDFTMGWGCVPQAYANGILVHNCLGKKLVEEIKYYKPKFIEGALQRGCPEHEAHKIWNKMEGFATYLFNRSHAVVYSMTGYFCQYLKYYFPMEFWTVSLQYAEEDEIPQRISEIRKFKGITILPPDINHSQRTFTSDFKTDTIYWSLGKIKFAGDIAVDAIIEEREKNGQFFDIKEFALRVNKTKVNKRVVTNLILSGCFDQLHKVEVPYQRREILKEFLKEDFLPEYETRDLFFWFVKQKQISQSGYYDYSQAVANSMIAFAPQRYLQPDRILVMENIDKVAVVAGLLIEILIKKSKKGEFAQLIIDHNNEIVEVTLWNESWSIYKSELQRSINRGVIVLGKVTADRYKKHNIIHSTEETVVEIF